LEFGTIPKGWKLKKFSEIIEINPSYNLKKGKSAPYLAMADIPTNSLRISGFIYRKFTSGTKFMNGDTLLARITPSLENGKTAFVDFLKFDEIGWGSTEFIVLRPKSPFPPEYGYCLARSEEIRSHAIINMTGTSGRQRVPENCFDDYYLAEPPISLLKEFSRISNTIFSAIQINGKKTELLQNIRNTLLPKLMSNKLSHKFTNL